MAETIADPSLNPLRGFQFLADNRPRCDGSFSRRWGSIPTIGRRRRGVHGGGGQTEDASRVGVTMNRRSLLRLSPAVGAGLVAAHPSRVRAQGSPATIRAGVAIADSYAEAYYGDDAGIFRTAGLALDIHPLANSGAIAAAIVGGSLDVGVGSPPQVAAARLNGLPFAFFAPSAVFVPEAPTTLLMVPKNSPIRTAADVNGKTVAADNLEKLPSSASPRGCRRTAPIPRP